MTDIDVEVLPMDDRRLVFFISPIGEEGTDTYRRANLVKRYLVEKSFPDDEYFVHRADDNVNPGSITPEIVKSIRAADLVVIDLTDSNPNVFYEAAVAHGYQRPIVHIMLKGQRPPFDVKDMRTVFYDTTDPELLAQAVDQLRTFGQYAIEHPEEIDTPLSQGGRFLEAERSTDPMVQALADLRSEVEELRRGLGRPNLFAPEINPELDVRRIKNESAVKNAVASAIIMYPEATSTDVLDLIKWLTHVGEGALFPTSLEQLEHTAIAWLRDRVETK